MNDIEVLINGSTVDLDNPNQIAAQFTGFEIGQIGRVSADVTSTIVLANTANNHSIMKNAADLGSNSAIALGEITATVIFNGIQVMNNGRAIVKSVKNGKYQINIFANNSGFLDFIRDKNLRDFDWSAFDVPETDLFLASTFSPYWNATSGIVIPFCEYSTELNDFNFAGIRGVVSTYFIPWMFVHTIISQIVSQSGYNLSGDILSDDNYRKLVIPLKHPKRRDLGEFDSNNDEFIQGTASGGYVIDDLMWDMNALDFLQGILFTQGAFLTTIGNTIYLIRYKDIYENQSSALDWSDKYHHIQNPSFAFNTDFAQRNWFRYQEIDPIENSGGTILNNSREQQDDLITSDNKNLPLERTIVELPFEGTRMIKTVGGSQFLYTNFWIGYLPCLEFEEKRNISGEFFITFTRENFEFPLGVLVDLSVTDSLSNPLTLEIECAQNSTFFTSDIRTVYFRDPIQPSNVTEDTTPISINWGSLLNANYYGVENSMLKNPRIIVADFYLSPKDILDLRSTLTNGKHGASVPIYVKGLNGHYIVSNIGRYIPNQLTSVELIRM